MNREILFRGRLIEAVSSKFKNQWIYGSGFLRQPKFDFKDCGYLIPSDTGEWLPVIPETVGQLWRRIKGNPLFDGDIFICGGIKRVCRYDENFGSICFANYDDLKDESWRQINQLPYSEWFKKYGEDFQVIGNIHDKEVK